MTGAKALLAFLLVAVASLYFLLPFCGWVYQCGCTSLPLGGAARCNIHQPEGPHCPWCVVGDNDWVGLLPPALILGGQGGVMWWVARRRHARFWLLLVVGFVAYWIFGLGVAYVFKLFYNYPYFLGGP